MLADGFWWEVAGSELELGPEPFPPQPTEFKAAHDDTARPSTHCNGFLEYVSLMALLRLGKWWWVVGGGGEVYIENRPPRARAGLR